MNKLILNNNNIKIKSIIYQDKNINIKEINDKYEINIGFSKNIPKLNIGEKIDISNYIYKDQNFITKKYSYIIEIQNNIFLTRINKEKYLLELNIPKVNITIPPFDNTNNKRVNLKDNEIEIQKLELYVSFNIKDTNI